MDANDNRPIHRWRILVSPLLFSPYQFLLFFALHRFFRKSHGRHGRDGASVARSKTRRRKTEERRAGRGEHNCAHNNNNGLCFRGGAERRSVNGARYFAGLGIDSLRDCLAELTLRSGYLNALFGETKLEFRTILLDGVSHCPRLCVAAASLSLLILVCYRQQWFYDSYVGNAPGIRTHSIGTYYSDRWMDT